MTATKVVLSTKVDQELNKWLRARAAANDRTVSAEINRILKGERARELPGLVQKVSPVLLDLNKLEEAIRQRAAKKIELNGED